MIDLCRNTNTTRTRCPGKLKTDGLQKRAGPSFTKVAGRGTQSRPAPSEIVCPACLRIQDKNPEGVRHIERGLQGSAS